MSGDREEKTRGIVPDQPGPVDQPATSVPSATPPGNEPPVEDIRVYNVLELAEHEVMTVFPAGIPQPGMVYGIRVTDVLLDTATNKLIVPLVLIPIARPRTAADDRRIVMPGTQGAPS